MVKNDVRNLIGFCCYVDAKVPVKVFLFDIITGTNVRIHHLEKSKYCNRKPTTATSLYTGWAFSCNVNSSVGEVHSNFRKVYVYNPKFTKSAPISLLMETPISAQTTYIDHQPPLHPMQTYRVCKLKENGECTKQEIRVLNATAKILHRSSYFAKFPVKGSGGRFLQNVTLRASITFVPEGAGLYQLLFVITVENNFMKRTDFITKGPRIRIDHYAEISEEKLLTPKVTLGAFGNLTVRLSTSVPLRKQQVLIRGPSDTILPADDLRFWPNVTSLSGINFVVSESGNYQVLFRDLRANVTGKKHNIRAAQPWLNTPSSPITKTLSDVVSVPVTYSGSEPPAFPARVFKVFKIDGRGSVVSTNVTVLNVTMVRIKENEYRVNVSFAPEKHGLFQIFFQCGGQTIQGPKISFKQDLTESVLMWIVWTILFVVAIGLVIIYWKYRRVQLRRFGDSSRKLMSELGRSNTAN